MNPIRNAEPAEVDAALSVLEDWLARYAGKSRGRMTAQELAAAAVVCRELRAPSPGVTAKGGGPAPAPGCQGCGGAIIGMRAGARYCSNACRQRAYRKRGTS